MQFRTIPLAQRQKIIIDQFQIDDATLEKITEEGMDRNWPPLSDNEEDSQVSESDIDTDSVKSIVSSEEAMEAIESADEGMETIESADEATESTEATDEVTHTPEA
ncbi:MAG: hypothetical protein NTV50_12985 [Planctomycetota bacterium]|nr:hypothetical protein [Planctomycetota bacterium]